MSEWVSAPAQMSGLVSEKAMVRVLPFVSRWEGVLELVAVLDRALLPQQVPPWPRRSE